MTIEEAIQKAIEGGFKKPNYLTSLHWALIFTDEKAHEKTRDIFRILYDLLFWQSLGKAMGWDDGLDEDGAITRIQWKYEWHRFIDHLADGKQVETFFATLQ